MADIAGTAGNDILQGTNQNDTLTGLTGADRISGLNGIDVVTGGPGFDTVVINYAAASTAITMAKPMPTGGRLVGYPPPGGVSFTPSGSNPANGVRTATYTGFDTSQYQKLWWGPTVQSAMDGQINSPTETMTLLSVNGTTATWGGQTTISTSGGYVTVYTLFIATITQGADGWAVTQPAGMAGGPQAVALINGDSFVVEQQFLASLDPNGPFTPFNPFYDSHHNLDMQARSSVTGQFLYDDGGVDGFVSGGALGSTTFHGVENLVITSGSGDDTLFGAGGADILTAGLGNDLLHGSAGDDRLYGGSGLDTVSYADAAGGVSINLVATSFQATGGSGTDVLGSIEHVIGSAFNDSIIGNQFGNTLTGGAGDDVLNGGLGNDILAGGDGIDTASYATASGDIRANLTLTGPQSTISAGSDTLSGIENLMGGAHNDQLTGDAGNNVLTGNAGNDILVGGAGDDALYGGAGVDTASYVNATGGVTISLLVTVAQDTGGAGIDTFTSIENLTGSAFDDVITGSAQLNLIYGGNGNDVIDAGSSNDTVDGGYGNDILKGAGGDDMLIGNVGSDTLTGGGGADTLTGGTQNDRFVYTALNESPVAGADRITDFAKGDILDVSAIDANSTLAGNQAFVQAAAFTHSAGQFTLAFDAGTNTTTALFDTNGDANADMAILFTGNVTALTSTWLL